jgi:PilZ domain
MVDGTQTREQTFPWPGGMVYYRRPAQEPLVPGPTPASLLPGCQSSPAQSSELVGQFEGIRADLAHERRRTPRLHNLAVETTAVPAPAELVGWSLTPLIDLSSGGLALQLDRPVSLGDTVLVWLGGDEPFALEIRHCRPEKTGWISGGKFVSRTWPGIVHRAGLTKKEAEALLDWLEDHGCAGAEVSADETGFVVWYSL